MQHDALEQVAQGHVVVLRDRLEDLEDALLELHARLHALHLDRRGRARGLAGTRHGRLLLCYVCTYVHMVPKKNGACPPHLFTGAAPTGTVSNVMVGVRGFEPRTSPSRTLRTT